MKELFDFVGGRSLVNDDLEAIQKSLDTLMSVYVGTGPFVVSGCEFTLDSGTDYNMTAGVVMLNGRLIEVEAQTINLASPKGFAEADVQDVDDREYVLLSTTKPGNRLHQVAIVSGNNPTQPGDTIFITNPSGGFGPQVRRFSHALQEIIYQPGVLVAVRDEITSKFVIGPAGTQGRDEWFGWWLVTATPGIVNPADMKDHALVGAGQAYNVDDTVTVNAQSGSGATSKFYAVHFVEFRGTRAEATTFV